MVPRSTRRRFLRSGTVLALGIGVAGCSSSCPDSDPPEPSLVLSSTDTPISTGAPSNRGTAGRWRQFRGDAANTGYAPSGSVPGDDAVVRWKRSLAGDPNERFGPPVLDGKTVFVAGETTGLYALDAWTGERRWIAPEARSASSPAVVDGVAHVNGPNGVVAVSTDEGETRWRASSMSIASTSDPGAGSESGSTTQTTPASSNTDTTLPAPAVVDGTVYVARGSVAAAFDALTGERRWRTTLTDAATSLAVAGGRVFVGGPEFEVRDATDGSTAWTGDLNHTSAPVVSGGRVYTGDYDGLHAFDVRDGTARWTYRREYSGFSTPAITDEDVVYAVEEPPEGPSAVFSLDAATGDPTPRWCSWLGTGLVRAVTPEAVLVETEVNGADGRAVQAFTPQFGDALWQFRARSTVVGVAVGDGIVCVTTGTGGAFAVGRRADGG